MIAAAKERGLNSIAYLEKALIISEKYFSYEN